MRNPCKHINFYVMALPSYIPPHDILQWCRDCGATRWKYDIKYGYERYGKDTRWRSPKLAKAGHSDGCYDSTADLQYEYR